MSGTIPTTGESITNVPRKLGHQRSGDCARNAQRHKQRQQKSGRLQRRVATHILEVQWQEVQVNLPDEVVCRSLQE